MSSYENSYEKKGHPVLGIVLGILGLLIGAMLPLLTGVIGGAIGLVLGILGVVLGILARRSGKGIASIVIGALAVIVALAVTMASVNTMKAMKEEAQTSGVAPLIAEYSDNPYLGFLGIASKLPQDEASLQQLQEEFNKLNEIMNTKNNAQ